MKTKDTTEDNYEFEPEYTVQERLDMLEEKLDKILDIMGEIVDAIERLESRN